VLVKIISRKTKDAKLDAWRTVLYDPEAAIALANSLRKGAEPTYSKRLGARFFAFGITPFADNADNADN